MQEISRRGAGSDCDRYWYRGLYGWILILILEIDAHHCSTLRFSHSRMSLNYVIIRLNRCFFRLKLIAVKFNILLSFLIPPLVY